MVKVRFAPSPTGFLHIGGARTCLFNWLYSRKQNGKFILRIEDTDKARSRKEYLDEILESIKWLGMDWDEIYYQSDRFDIYKESAAALVKSGKAQEKDGAVFFKYQFDQIELDDLIRGKIVFNELPKEEEVIIKSDGSPTYNFSCVVDDAAMKIDCVIRGEDHISNTPKQILMYKALGFPLPKFAHVPLILSPQGGRMSKRHGATSIREYRQMGYLSEAIVNYLLLLGWSPGKDREIISLEEVKDVFDIKNVTKTGAAFSMDKLNWVNVEYLKRKNADDFSVLMKEHLREKNFLPDSVNEEYIRKVAALFKDRITKLSDLSEWSYFCFYDDYVYAEDAAGVLERNLSKEIQSLSGKMAEMDNFTHDAIEREFRATVEDLGLKAKDLVHPVRVALTGKRVGPGLFETMEVLGKDKVLQRLQRLIKYWEEKNKL